MRHLFIVIISAIVLLASVSVNGQVREVPDVTVEDLIERIETPSDTVFVVNFWATWCLPCVKEIPEFNKIKTEFNGTPVQVIMASLDFPDQKDSRVMPFLENHTVTHEVIMTLTPRGGDWIARVEDRWTGAIPATLVIHNGHRRFHEGEIDYPRLMEKIQGVSTNQ